MMEKKKIILWSLILSCMLGIFLGSSGTAICNAKKTKINRQQITKNVNDLTDWMAISFLGDWRYQSGWNNQKLDLATREKIIGTVMYFERTNNGRKISKRLFGRSIAKSYKAFEGEWGDAEVESRIINLKRKKNEIIVRVQVFYNSICGKYSFSRKKVGDVELTFRIAKKRYILKAVRTKSHTDATKEAGKYPLYEVNIDRIQEDGDKVLVVGDARVPVDPQKTAKQRKQLSKGKLTLFGRTWIAKKVKKKDAMTTYYLYKSKRAKAYTYELQEDMPWLNYPSYILKDRQGRRIYNDVGKVYMWVGTGAFSDSGGATAYQKFISGTDWKGKWIPIEVNKNQATAVDPNGAKK